MPLSGMLMQGLHTCSVLVRDGIVTVVVSGFGCGGAARLACALWHAWAVSGR
jgi:hypothetical protein